MDIFYIIGYVLSILNTGILLILGLNYLKNKYTIVTIEQWNEIAQVYNTLAEKNLLDCIDDLTPNQEVCGGVGFFKEQVEEEYEDE